jgi:hypothetical protein
MRWAPGAPFSLLRRFATKVSTFETFVDSATEQSRHCCRPIPFARQGPNALCKLLQDQIDGSIFFEPLKSEQYRSTRRAGPHASGRYSAVAFISTFVHAVSAIKIKLHNDILCMPSTAARTAHLQPPHQSGQCRVCPTSDPPSRLDADMCEPSFPQMGGRPYPRPNLSMKLPVNSSYLHRLLLMLENLLDLCT